MQQKKTYQTQKKKCCMQNNQLPTTIPGLVELKDNSTNELIHSFLREPPTPQTHTHNHPINLGPRALARTPHPIFIHPSTHPPSMANLSFKRVGHQFGHSIHSLTWSRSGHHPIPKAAGTMH